MAKQTPEPTPSQPDSYAHRRKTSKDSICDSSPYISRRALDAHTDQELRLACRLILQNFKPSDHGMENTDPKLDFGAMGRRKESKSQPAEVRVRMPTGAPADLPTTTVGRKPSKTRTRAKADQEIRARTQGDIPVRANSSRKRADFAWLDERDDKREEKLKTYGKSPSIDLPRSAALASSSSDEDITLPVTVASTLAHSKVASTAPTSASLPSGRSSNRRSRQLENPAAIADAQAAEWMRAEKSKLEASQPQARPSTAARPPSRAASIKEGIRGYVFPGTRSRALSRAQSKESLRATDAGDEQDLQRSGSNSGAAWRSWGGLRRSGSRSNSRPGTSKGPVEDGDQPRKSESHGVNLNRELPPLPGLDQWKEPEQPKVEKPTSPKSPTAGTHIASMMRPQEHHTDRSPAARKQHRKSGSDTLAMQYAQAFPPRQSSRAHPDAPLSPHSLRSPGPLSPSHLDPKSSSHTRHRSGESIPTSAGGTGAATDAATFSRNMSLDNTPSRSVSNENKQPTKREEQKSRLKNIFSGWMTKKEKKDDWMHKLEKEGVKEGVLVQDGAASPVVRY